jgi:hypothetical protein
MPMKPQTEDLLERLAFELGVAAAEAESGRATDADLRARMAGLCRKWQGDIEALITAAADPGVSNAAQAVALKQDNAGLRQELESARKENGDLKADIEKLQASPPPQQKKTAPPQKPAEEPKKKTEFDEAMKDVKRY